MRFSKRKEVTVLDKFRMYDPLMEVKVQAYEILDVDERFPRLIVYATPNFHQWGDNKGQPNGVQNSTHWNVAELHTAMLIPIFQNHSPAAWKTRQGAADAAVKVLSDMEPDKLESMRNIGQNNGKVIHNGKVLSEYPVLNTD